MRESLHLTTLPHPPARVLRISPLQFFLFPRKRLPEGTRSLHSPLVRRPDERRTEFLLAASPSVDIADLLALPHSQAALFPEIAATWGGPLRQHIRVTLSGHAFDELTGRLEIATSPDFPLNHRRALLRCSGEFTFAHRQITGWATA